MIISNPGKGQENDGLFHTGMWMADELSWKQTILNNEIFNFYIAAI